MTEIVLFHHALGLTSGVRGFADRLRQHGHTVHTPDLYDGRVFDDLDAGVAFGMDKIDQRGRDAAAGLPSQVVYAGMSMGVMPAQALAQTSPDALGALFLHACLPVTEFSAGWPSGVPVQIHGMEGDEFFMADSDAALALVDSARNSEVFLYPGDDHLFTDNSLGAYDASATELLLRRAIAFLAEIDERLSDSQ